MALLAYDKQTNKVVNAQSIHAVDKIMDLKEKKSPWEVIELLTKMWIEKSPEEFEGHKVSISDLKETRKDPKFGKTEDKNMDRRLIMVFPTELQRMIRKVYPVEELQFDKKFFQEFATRFKAFKIPEKL